MKKNSLVNRLTLMTFVVFMVFLIIAFLLEGMFFKSFYIDDKINSINKNIEDFSDDYNYFSWDKDQLLENIGLFNTLNDVEIAVLDEYAIDKTEEIYQIIIEDKNKKIYNLQMNHLLNENARLLLPLNIGDKITAKGFVWPNTNIIFKPFNIKKNNKLIISYIDDFKGKTIEGKVLGFNLPNYYEINSPVYKKPIRNIVLDFIFEYGNRYKLLNKKGEYEVLHEDELLNQLVFYKPMVIDNKKEVIIAVGSERHIIEAKRLLSDYQRYILITSLILIIILSYFYSSALLKPILIIIDKAKKMANLDFSEKISIKRNDELGSLSESLNILSTNLSNNIKELEDANKKLIDDIERERNLENLRKEFVSGVSHELKTPLGIIRGYVEGVKDGVFDDNNYYLDVVIEETKKMDALVIDMLELSKLESENFKINKERFDIINHISDIINKFEYSLMEKNLSIDFITNKKEIFVYADEFRIDQVITNYIKNAIRHSLKDESIIISIEENDDILFSVQNKGDKIPEDKISKVWNRFYRVDYSRNRSKGDIGLGLSIVRNIIDAHNGSYGVENTKDGVRFYFSLKREKDEN